MKPGWTRIVGEKDIANRTQMSKVGNVSSAVKMPEDPVSSIQDVGELVTVKHELTKGTTRGTYHIPGYQGTFFWTGTKFTFVVQNKSPAGSSTE